MKVLNMTNLFTREMLLYSLFEVKLPKPVRIIFVGYYLIVFLIIGVPLIYLLGVGNGYLLVLEFGIPAVFAHFLSQPIWGGKSFLQFMICQIKYIYSPKLYFDGEYGKKPLTYKINHEIQVSRRDDFNKLKLMIHGEMNNE